MDKAEQLAEQVKSIWRSADVEGRELTPEERGEVETLIARIKQERSGGKAVREVATMIGGGVPRGGVEGQPGDGSPEPLIHPDPGTAFIQSAGFKRITDSETRGQRWSSGAIPVGYVQMKGTLLEGAGAPGSGSGGGLIPAPDVIPGVVEKYLSGPLGVAALFPQQMVDTNTVRYVVEGTAVSGAAGVAEGGAKPESTLGLSVVDEPVRKIATSVTVSDELLDDAAATQGYVSGRLQAFIKLEEERELLAGSGANNIVGITNRPGVNTFARGTLNNAVALATAIANTRGSSYVEPTGIIMNPVNWLSTRLLTDSQGQFLGGGPFGVAAQNAGAAGIFEQALWDKPVVLSDAIGAGTALVGGFGTAALLARRGGLTVEATNSHQDYFTKDLMVLRSEQREALCVYRANAFTIVTGLS